MPEKTLIMFGMVVGSTIGGFVPKLFGISTFSFTSLLTSGAGAVIGIYLAYRMTR